MNSSTKISWSNVEKFVYYSIETVFDDYNGYGGINVIKASELMPKTTRKSIEGVQDLHFPPTNDVKFEDMMRKKEQDQKEKELERRELMDKSIKEGIFEGDEIGDELEIDDVANVLDDEEVMELL